MKKTLRILIAAIALLAATTQTQANFGPPWPCPPSGCGVTQAK